MLSSLRKAVSNFASSKGKVVYPSIIELPQVKVEEAEVLPEYVAVYGNEKSGFCRHYILGKELTFMGRGRTKKRYAMVGRGLPMIFKSPRKAPVIVEVYTITSNRLRTIDTYHSNGFLSDREKVTITMDDDSEVQAWLYINDNKWKKQDQDFAPPNTTGGYEWQGFPILP